MQRTAWFIAAALLAPAGPALAQAASPGVGALDPGRPPQAVLDAARAERRAKSASPRGVDAEAEAHLRASFQAADRAHRGLLTREEARAGGFGWIANHFDAIDTRHAGEVSFEDVQRYLQANKATGKTNRSAAAAK